MSAFKFVLCIGIVAASLKDARALTEEEAKNIFSTLHEAAGDCKKEFGVTKETFKEAKAAGSIDAIDPCFFACLYKKLEIMNDEGKYDEAIAIEKTKNFMSNEEDLNKAKEILEECSSVNGEEVSDGAKGCDRAKLLFVCFAKFKDVFGMPPH